MKMPIALGILAFSALATGAAAAEKPCQRSCTEVAQTCVSLGAASAACNAGMAACLKTGRLSMPSGKTFKNLCKR